MPSSNFGNVEEVCKVFRFLLTDISKASDYLDHELFFAQIHTYGFSLPALRSINDCLSNRNQRTKIENQVSKYGVFSGPQGYDQKRKLFRTNSFVLAHSSAKKFYIKQLTVKSSIQWYHMTLI